MVVVDVVVVVQVDEQVNLEQTKISTNLLQLSMLTLASTGISRVC